MSLGGCAPKPPRPVSYSPAKLISQQLARKRRRAAGKVAKQSRKDNRHA